MQGETQLGISGRLARVFKRNAMTPLMAIVALLLGVFAVLVTPREEEPQINVTMANVLIPFPGASSEDVQNMVARPAEQVLSQIAGIEHTFSVASPGMAVMTVQFEVDASRALFMEKLDVDVEIADLLIAEGFVSLEQVAYVPLEEMLEIDSFDEDTVNELRARAKDAMLTMEIANEENAGKVATELSDLEGLTPDLISKLADHGVHTLDDLADLAGDELTDITGQSEEDATAMIMKARAHWFSGDAAAQTS